MTRSNKPGDDVRRAANLGPPPPYGAPAFRFRHEVRERAESSAEAYRRANPQFFKPLTWRQAQRQARRSGWMADERVIADVSSYEQMLAALRSRYNELQINGERFDEFAGLPRGYLSKLIGARPVRRLGMTSFAPVLAGLGLRLLVIEDQEATERLRNHLSPLIPAMCVTRQALF